MAATELDFQHVAAHPASDDMIDSAWDFRRRPPVASGCGPIHARLSSIIRDSRICQWEACKTIEAHEDAEPRDVQSESTARNGHLRHCAGNRQLRRDAAMGGSEPDRLDTSQLYFWTLPHQVFGIAAGLTSRAHLYRASPSRRSRRASSHPALSRSSRAFHCSDSRRGSSSRRGPAGRVVVASLPKARRDPQLFGRTRFRLVPACRTTVTPGAFAWSHWRLDRTGRCRPGCNYCGRQAFIPAGARRGRESARGAAGRIAPD
jgi:hypothetical protein